MAGHYVPPALRNKTNDTNNPPEGKAQLGSQSTPARRPSHAQNGLVSLEDIRAHFWPQERKEASHSPPPLKGTLNASAADPSTLAYVVLFKDANPRWESDGIIFTKSNLDLIQPQMEHSGATLLARDGRAEDESATSDTVQPAKPSPTTTDDLISSTAEGSRSSIASLPPPELDAERHSCYAKDLGPIAVFAQGRGPQGARSFQFIGWYKITRLIILEPGSADLGRMLEQKWSRQDRRTGIVKHKERDTSKWQESLAYRWASMQMERDGVANKDRGKLVVVRLPDRVGEGDLKQGGSRKTVNEMLAEMRVGGS